MKFESELAEATFPEWKDKYASYGKLKRMIERLQLLDIHNQPYQLFVTSSGKHIRRPLQTGVANVSPEDRETFFSIVDEDIDRINHFYEAKSGELYVAFQLLLTKHERSGDDESMEAGLLKKISQSTSTQIKMRTTVKRDTLKLYREVNALSEYQDINYRAILKIVRDYDNFTGESNLLSYRERLQSQPFMEPRYDMKSLAVEMEKWYHDVTGQELVTLFETPPLTLTQRIKKLKKPIYVVLAFVLAGIVWLLPILNHDGQDRAHKCAVLVVFVTTLWVTEAIPFFVTSLSIPFFTVIMKILGDENGNPLKAEAAAQQTLSHVFDHTLALVLGGFTLSAAFSSNKFELYIAWFLQRRIGHRPKLFLLAFMFLVFFLSLWISNVAAPVLCTTVILPILRDLSPESPYARTMVMGLALAGNIGGMGTPIASPQNAVTIGYYNRYASDDLTFLDWIEVSIPICLLLVFLGWLFLVLAMHPNDVTSIPEIVFEKKRIGIKQVVVLSVSFVTIVLWCTLSLTEDFFGDMGIVALIPIVLLFGSDILTKREFNSFQWNLIFLIGGGNVLGAAVSSSGLLQIVTEGVAPEIEKLPTWIAFACVMLFVLVVTTFVSHTVSSIILIPAIITIGAAIGHVKMIVVAAGLMLSGAMALPMSSFPNVNSLLLEDDYGNPYLHVVDFLKFGGPFSVIVVFILLTAGYLLLLVAF